MRLAKSRPPHCQRWNLTLSASAAENSEGFLKGIASVRQPKVDKGPP